MKIKFLPNWCTSEDGTKRLFDQFYIDQYLEGIEFVHGDEFDMIVYCGYVQGEAPDHVKKYIFNMEPKWSGNVQRSNAHTNAIIYAQSKEIYSHPDTVVEFPTYMFYGAGGEGWTVQDTQIDYEKTKNISCVISQLKNIHNIPDCLYDKRRDVVTRLLNSKVPVDVYGWEYDSPNAAGGLPRKINGLIDYKFSVAIENSREQNFLTEKFYDCILTNTIPIYYGAPNIKQIFPENGFIELKDIDDLDGVEKQIQFIYENADRLYEEMLPELKKIKKRFFSRFNLLTKIIELAKEN